VSAPVPARLPVHQVHQPGHLALLPAHQAVAIALDQAVQPAVDTLAADSQAAAAQVAAVDSQAAQAAAVAQATAAAGAAEDAKHATICC